MLIFSDSECTKVVQNVPRKPPDAAWDILHVWLIGGRRRTSPILLPNRDHHRHKIVVRPFDLRGYTGLYSHLWNVQLEIVQF